MLQPSNSEKIIFRKHTRYKLFRN